MEPPSDGTAREHRARRQKAVVEECRAAMPDELAPLWETMLHAPNHAFEAVVDALSVAIDEDEVRLTRVLSWYGHGDGTCPVCWMLVGKLVYAVEEPIDLLARLVTEAADAELLEGACRFLDSQLLPRHARIAGLSRDRLDELVAQARALPGTARAVLLARWEAGGREGQPAGLA